MFENIPAAPEDSILSLTELFLADTRINKINLGIGVYKNESGKTPILNSVKKAEEYLLENETTKNYLSIDGIPALAACTLELLFGRDSSIIKEKRAHAAQTPGGTAALRVAADFIAKQTSANKRIWISNPSWPNHKSLFNAAGLEVREYDYYEDINHRLDFSALQRSLEQAEPGDVVLFQGCCHNPTGIDPTPEQWEIMAEMSLAKGWLQLFDFAYQGFAESLEEDAKGLRIFAAKHNELLIASSYSKNFSLYNERVGVCTLVASDRKTTDNTFSQIKAAIRANYSNPPAHGGAVVARILCNKKLRTIWEEELADMRRRIQSMRELFIKTIQDKGAAQEFGFIREQKGMFSLSRLSNEQVIRLRDDFGIYALNSGRVNMAGMTIDNMDSICEAIIAILNSST
ncbi:amino acid aminotransferase [Candidatus Profftia tarda]|nr:amino acid aminotransferase [Candidatus Profftia tarda]